MADGKPVDRRRKSMKHKPVSSILLAAFTFALLVSWTAAQVPQVIKLLKPQTDGGRPLMQCLKDRQSARAFKPDKLSDQVLSDLLWAADGVNRPDSNKRTAPTAMNIQNIDIYVSTADGLYIFDPVQHALKVVLSQDVRSAMGAQDFVKAVPLNLIYVADLSKMQRGTDEDKALYSGNHCGYISQNVYLFCASEGLATVVRGSINRDEIAKLMKLRPDQRVILAQSVGYPQK
jgi:SagB-type dehydrogenase family enzyme